MESAYNYLFTGALIALAILLFACLLRAVIGPRMVDRILAINMTGTIVIMMIVVLALKQSEGYLVDVALIYTMLSFLAVVLLTRVYIGIYNARKDKDPQQLDEEVPPHA